LGTAALTVCGSDGKFSGAAEDRRDRLAVSVSLSDRDMHVKHDCKGLVQAPQSIAQNGFSTTSSTIAIMISVGTSFTMR
jgi:hypothetical protein